jgi:protein transport protein SEC13
MAKSPQIFESGHADAVHDVQMDFYGKRLASASSDRVVKVFDISGDVQQPIADLAGHEGPVWQVSWAHPKFGSLLASCSFDHTVIIWREAQEGVWSQVRQLTDFLVQICTSWLL